MKVTLKKIKHSESLSEETNAFTADVYVNGKYVGYAKNDGQGGSTYIRPDTTESRVLLEEAEAHFRRQPMKVVTYGDNTYNIQPSLEDEVDAFLEDYLKGKDKVKFEKKMQKDMQKGLVIEAVNGKSYSLITWGYHTINSLLMHPKGKRTLQDAIDKVSKEGRKVLNTNLPKDMLEQIK